LVKEAVEFATILSGDTFTGIIREKAKAFLTIPEVARIREGK